MVGLLKDERKVIGYFSYTDAGQVFCEGDACVIAGSIPAMDAYLNRLAPDNQKDLIRKTRFGEIMKGIGAGGAYVFDGEAYKRFNSALERNGMDELSTKDVVAGFSEARPFVRIQIRQ